MKEDHACFFALMIVLFFTASAFFQAVLFMSDRGDRRLQLSVQFFKFVFTYWTADELTRKLESDAANFSNSIPLCKLNSICHAFAMICHFLWGAE
jgi:hypothetical protein